MVVSLFAGQGAQATPRDELVSTSLRRFSKVANSLAHGRKFLGTNLGRLKPMACCLLFGIRLRRALCRFARFHLGLLGPKGGFHKSRGRFGEKPSTTATSRPRLSTTYRLSSTLRQTESGMGLGGLPRLPTFAV